MKIRFNFDVTSIERCEETFAKAKSEMGIWEWEKGGYESLYRSNMNRLGRENANKKHTETEESEDALKQKEQLKKWKSQ